MSAPCARQRQWASLRPLLTPRQLCHTGPDAAIRGRYVCFGAAGDLIRREARGSHARAEIALVPAVVRRSGTFSL